MRICYLANAGSIHFPRWYEYFIEKGHEVHLISGNTSSLEYHIDIKGLKVYYLPEFRVLNRVFSFGINLFNLPRILSHLRKLLTDISPDIMHAHQIHPYGFWGALMNFHPFITTPIGSDILIAAQKYFLYREIAKYVLKKSDLVTGDSLLLKTACLELGLNEKDYYLIHNGVDLTKFTNGPDTGIVRKKYGISKSAPVIFYGRGLAPLYNLEKVIQAIPLVLSEFPDSKFIFSHHCGELGPRLKKMVKSLDLRGSVIFTGLIQHGEMPLFIRSADICISVPSSDSSPSFVYEAMACGIPTIISNLPWTEYAMKHLENTYMIAEIEPSVIAKAIMKLLNDHELRKKIIRGGLQTSKKYFCYHENMANMQELMVDLLTTYREKYKNI